MTFTASPTHASTSRGGFRLTLLTVGPVLTLAAFVALVARGSLEGIDLLLWSVGAAALWSPLPLSVPAVLMDHERDTALVGMPRGRRALLLLPWLMFSSRSAARQLATRSVVSFILLVAGLVALGHVA